MKIFIISLVFIANLYASKNSSYSLDTFVQKALEASFVIKLDDAQIEVEKGKVAFSTLWENPDFEMAFDNEFENSVDYTYLELSQKLPAWGASEYKKNSANADLKIANYAKDITTLGVQYKAASLFQEILFLQSKLDILDQQLLKVEYIREIAVVREKSGDISGLERSRIDIIREQIVIKKQRLKNSYLRVKLQAQSLLNIEGEILLLADEIKPKEVDVDILISSLEKSPKYCLYESKVYRSKQEKVLAKTKLYALPEVYFYNENKNVEDIFGFGFRLSVPLWGSQDAKIEIKSAQITKNSIKAKEVMYKLQKDVQSYYKLYKNSLTQLEDYKSKLLAPSKKFYELSTFSYEAGEKSLLELLDAQRLYFQSQLEYYTLISQSNLYWLQLCNAASIDLLKDNL